MLYCIMVTHMKLPKKLRVVRYLMLYLNLNVNIELFESEYQVNDSKNRIHPIALWIFFLRRFNFVE